VDQHETTTPTERKPLGRRTVLKGAAWSVPAVVAVGATPAFAATGQEPTISITSISVAPPAEDAIAPSLYINLVNNDDAVVTIIGNATPGSSISVTTDDYTSTEPIIADSTTGDWSHAVPSSALAEGVYQFRAEITGASADAPNVIRKDLTAPTVASLTAAISPGTGNKGGTVSGTMGVAETPSADSTTLIITSNVAGFATTGFTGPDGAGVWSAQWTTTANANKGTITVTQSDAAGNVSIPATTTIT